MKEFKSEYKDAYYKDESKSLKNKNKNVKDLNQN